MSTNKPNYLDLTEKQKNYIRENAGRVSIETMVKVLYTSRHEIVAFIIEEKLPMQVIKKRIKKPAGSQAGKKDWMKQFM